MLKDWEKSKKYHSIYYTIYKNKLPEYEKFDNNYHITLGRIFGRSYLSIYKNRKQILVKEFKTRSQTLKFAKQYMRTH